MKFNSEQGKKLNKNTKKIEFKKSNSPIYSYLCIATLLFGHFLNCSVMIRNGCFVGSNCSNLTDGQQTPMVARDIAGRDFVIFGK